MEKRRIIEIAGFFLLAGVAVAGWTHHGNSVASSGTVPPDAAVYGTAVNQPPTAPMISDLSSYPVPFQSASRYRAVYIPATPAATPYESQTYYNSQRYRHGRSTRKSVAIVAGSAGVGAAVGALAGGGKGAGIGALAGGGAGLLYDRLTHKTHSGL